MSKRILRPGCLWTRLSALNLTCLVVLASCFCGPNWHIAQGNAAEPAAADNEDVATEGKSFLDRDADLPELQTFLQSGPNDVRDILVVDDGFLVATGTAIIRYRYSGDTPVAAALYTARDGLPCGNCYLLKRDADGGIWAYCQGGVGYLAAKASRWKTFSQQNGLAPGNTTAIALSGDGKRIWVVGTGGLATARIEDLRWQAFPAKNLIDILVHPSKDIVWCRELMLSRCMCGRHIVSLQFDLQSRIWQEIPNSGNCPNVALIPSSVSAERGLLWMSGGSDPPMAYDLKRNLTRTWPREPNWERLKEGYGVEYSDWFGEGLPAAGNTGGHWFATNAGLWYYAPANDRWVGHLRNIRPGCGRPLLACGLDGKTLYWSCEGNVAAYTISTGKWADLWHVDENASCEVRPSMTLSPDGKALWLIGRGGVVVGQPTDREVTDLDDTVQPGLSAAKFVRFDPRKRLALIGTPQGVVCTDYNGNARFVLSRAAPPIHHEVTRFVIAPDDSEVWCAMRDQQGYDVPAAVLFPRKNRWELVPDPGTSAGFHDVAFSPDGKTVWLSRSNSNDDLPSVVQKKPGESQWEPLRAKMSTDYCTVKRLWATPRGDELWLGTDGSGLFRVKLVSGVVQCFGGVSRLDRTLGEVNTWMGDYIRDLAFTPDGKLAVCSAGGSSKESLAVIDLGNDTAAAYATEDFFDAKLVAAPDNRTVWCHVNGRLLCAFDLQTRTWTHRFSGEKSMPLSCFRALQCSPDGKFLWLRGWQGAAVYCLAKRSWQAFVGEQWQTSADDPPPLCITADGKHALCGHREGLAMITIDGSSHELLSLGAGVKDCNVTGLVALRDSDDFVCSVSHPQAGGIYYVDTKHRKLRKVKELKDSTVSALAIGPDGFLWAQFPEACSASIRRPGKSAPILKHCVLANQSPRA